MMRTNKAASWKRFPIGELARQRKLLKENYLESDAERPKLQKDLNIVQKDVTKISKRVDRHKRKLVELCSNDQLLSEKRRRLEPKTFAGCSKRKETIRQKTPSKLHQENSEKLCSDIPDRSAQRRRKETLAAADSIHGSSEENGKKPGLDSLWVTLINECSQK